MPTIDGATSPVERATGLPPALYTDPEIYRLEEDVIFRRSWIAIGRVHQQDMVGCRAVQQGVSSRFAQPGRLSDLEKGVWQFNNWVREQLAGAS